MDLQTEGEGPNILHLQSYISLTNLSPQAVWMLQEPPPPAKFDADHWEEQWRDVSWVRVLKVLNFPLAHCVFLRLCPVLANDTFQKKSEEPRSQTRLKLFREECNDELSGS